MSDCYSLNQCKRVIKDLHNVDGAYKQLVLKRIKSLRDNPFPHGYKHLAQFPGCYRIRAGEYRICYKIDDAKHEIVLMTVSPRRMVYDVMERLT